MASLGSLVADYSDSDTDSETITQAASSSNLPTRDPSGAEAGNTSSEEDSDDCNAQSEDESPGDEEPCPAIERLPNPLAQGDGGGKKLPPPLLGGSSTGGVPGSVFVNPYLKAEEAKQSVLEKHVKMTNYVEEEETKAKQKKRAKDKRKMCHKFIKGNCRYGNKCRFSHDISIKPEATEEETFNANKHANYGNRSWNAEITDESSKNDDDSYMAEAKKKKRSGVTDHLHPPKKAMKALHQQRGEERPWTVQK